MKGGERKKWLLRAIEKDSRVKSDCIIKDKK